MHFRTAASAFLFRTIAWSCSLFVLALPLAAGAQPRYTAVDLGTPGAGPSFGRAVNAIGQVAGMAKSPVDGLNHAVSWSAGVATDLGTLGTPTSDAVDINSSGQVVGESYIVPGSRERHAALWSGTTGVDLGTLPGDYYSAAFGINDHGQAVGYSSIAGDVFTSHAVRWDGRTIADLGTLGGIASEAYAINNRGQAAGDFTALDGSGNPVIHAVRWTGSSGEDLGALGGRFAIGAAINESGQVAGYYRPDPTHPNVFHAALWTGTTSLDLGMLGGTFSKALGINAAGDVVGTSGAAFLYTGGHMFDLNSLVPADAGWDLGLATDINDSGWITGTGLLAGEQHAFLLIPSVPEPSALALMAAGLGLLGAIARRRGVASSSREPVVPMASFVALACWAVQGGMRKIRD